MALVGDFGIATTPIRSVFHRPLRTAVAGLWLAGVALAGLTATRAWPRVGVTRALPYLAVTVGGIALATTVLRGSRVALAVSTVLLGAQIFGVIGAAWELTQGVRGSKARELRDIGFDPEFGVALNIVYSALASAVFAWIVVRWRSARRGGTSLR